MNKVQSVQKNDSMSINIGGVSAVRSPQKHTRFVVVIVTSKTHAFLRGQVLLARRSAAARRHAGVVFLHRLMRIYALISPESSPNINFNPYRSWALVKGLVI